MTQQVDLKTMSITDLKALAYDCLATLQKIQGDLNLVNQEITTKSQIKKEEVAV